MGSKKPVPPPPKTKSLIEQKRDEFDAWQRSEYFETGDVSFTTLKKCIEECGMTMLPSLLSTAVRSAVREGCFRDNYAMMQFIMLTIDKETKGKNTDD